MTRRTKILATLGPATDSLEKIQALIAAGANTVRMNFSHGQAEDHIERAKRVRQAAKNLGKYVAILGDLQGPKIRVARFAEGAVRLEVGAKFILDAELGRDEGDINQVGIDYKALPDDVSAGDILLLDDGRIQLRVTGVEGRKVITEVTVKILKKPDTVKAILLGFQSIEDAGNSVMKIISNGVIPAGMEIMDKVLLEATNNFSKAGYPLEAEAMLIVELDGTKSEVEEQIKKVSDICKQNKCTSVKISKSDEERLKFWSGRKAAFPACGEMAPDYYCVDGTIPRSKLAKVLREITKLSKKYKLPVANAFHAGDGNLHPIIMFDANDKISLQKTEKFGEDILKLCVKFGGVLSGEHGIGIEKRELMCEMFNDNDIQQQINIKNSLDPSSLLNPGKVYPILRKCAEEGRLHIHGRDKSKFSDIPRF